MTLSGSIDVCSRVLCFHIIMLKAMRDHIPLAVSVNCVLIKSLKKN
jgi:hypothetical protein